MSIKGIYTEKEIVEYLSKEGVSLTHPPSAGKGPVITALVLSLLFVVGAILLILGGKKAPAALLISANHAQEQLVAGYVFIGCAALTGIAGVLLVRRRNKVNQLAQAHWAALYEQMQTKLKQGQGLIVQRENGTSDCITKSSMVINCSNGLQPIGEPFSIDD